ncbi:MAG: lysophospholipid acyltransferase family protein [Deltaproteobacteria bacterium]|nr:lysophospholipid acyltransferase family protein [Deltaproteobacteria bacterium]
MTDSVNLAFPARLLFLFLRVIPTGLRRYLFCRLALAYYQIDLRRRLITLHNLSNAFPDKSMDEVQRLAKGAYRNIAIVAAEFADLPFWTKENISNIMDVDGLDHCEAALRKNRGLLLFGAHFGNWELGVIATSLLLKPLVLIYRPLDNSVLENLVTWIRQSTGNRSVAKNSAMWPMVRVLRQNGIVGLLIDQNVSHYEGVFVNYFGFPTCTTNGLAHLALLTGAPVVPTFMVRKNDNHYHFVFGPEVEIIRTDDRENDIVENTATFTAIIEEMVRQYPDQWLWLHERWKEKKEPR